jgi:hypothetical protein
LARFDAGCNPSTHDQVDDLIIMLALEPEVVDVTHFASGGWNGLDGRLAA